MALPRLLSSQRSSAVTGTPDLVWDAVIAAGGQSRWYVDAAPWVVRGGLDRLVGGSGRQWPVPTSERLHTGDRAGFWRVLEADHDRHRLVLEAAVRAPGRVTLTTWLEPLDEGRCTLRQRVEFTPSGVLGTLYLVADLPAREAVIALCHRRIRAEILR